MNLIKNNNNNNKNNNHKTRQENVNEEQKFFVISRSLAFNNLETLPKDVFKGLEALTKVYV